MWTDKQPSSHTNYATCHIDCSATGKTTRRVLSYVNAMFQQSHGIDRPRSVRTLLHARPILLFKDEYMRANPQRAASPGLLHRNGPWTSPCQLPVQGPRSASSAQNKEKDDAYDSQRHDFPAKICQFGGCHLPWQAQRPRSHLPKVPNWRVPRPKPTSGRHLCVCVYRSECAVWHLARCVVSRQPGAARCIRGRVSETAISLEALTMTMHTYKDT
jgi:hypothetical protein